MAGFGRARFLAGVAATSLSQAALGLWSPLLGVAVYFLVRGVVRFFRERAFLQAQIRRMEQNIPTDL